MTSDDDKKDKEADPPENSVPEVAAEVVTEDAPDPASPFDDDAQTGPPDNEEAKTTKPKLLSPGVLAFGALVLLAVAAGVYWRFSSGAATPVDENPPIRAEERAETVQERSPESKLSNEAAAPAKDVASTLPSARNSDETLSSPPDALDDNLALQETAKEAATARSDDENVEEALVDAPAAPTTFEIGSAEQDQPASEPSPQSDRDEIVDAVDPSAMEARDIETENAEMIDPFPDEPATLPAGRGLANDDPLAAPAPSDETVAGLEADIAAARARIAELETENAALAGDLAALREELAFAREETETARAERDAIAQRNAALEEELKDAPAAAGAVALNDIARAVEKGEPYARELSLIAELAADDDAVADLEAFAETGAPTYAELRRGFADAAREGLAVAHRAEANNVIDRYGARVAALFNLRPAAPQPGDAPTAVISRAEYAVENGDIAAALEELNALPAEARAAMDDWISLAHRRAAADRALMSLNAAFAEQTKRGPDAL